MTAMDVNQDGHVDVLVANSFASEALCGLVNDGRCVGRGAFRVPAFRAGPVRRFHSGYASFTRRHSSVRFARAAATGTPGGSRPVNWIQLSV